VFCTIYCDNTNYLQYSWSFGVVLWEISTLGGSPYPGIPAEDLFTYINQGYRMAKPDVCPDVMYQIMKLCWHPSMNERPEFDCLVETIDEVLKEKLPVRTTKLTKHQKFVRRFLPVYLPLLFCFGNVFDRGNFYQKVPIYTLQKFFIF